MAKSINYLNSYSLHSLICSKLYRFRRMCILSGCDYLPSLPGIGLGKAFKLFSQITNADIDKVLVS